MNHEHAKLALAYLEELCLRLDHGERRLRRRGMWWRQILPVPVALGVTLGAAACGGEAFAPGPEPVNDAGTSSDGGTHDTGGQREICDDGIDNNGNGKIDCDDQACNTLPICVGLPYGVPFEDDCEDKVDNDGDLLVDCDDPDCLGYPICNGADYAAPFEICDNGIDDDLDTKIDCADDDCASDPYCTPSSDGGNADGGIPGEICGNGRDDDGDGFTDCQDPECFDQPPCIGEPMYAAPS